MIFQHHHQQLFSVCGETGNNMERNRIARESILGRIRKNSTTCSQSGVSGSIPKPPEPSYEEGWLDDYVSSFTTKLALVHGTSERISRLAELPMRVNKFMGSIRENGALLVSTHPELSELDWSPRQADFRRANKSDRVSVTMAFAGIAETGTIAMISGADSPITPNYLPEINVAVLKCSTIIPTLEDLWPLIDEQPRAINLITGPSKTADIEQTIVYGAHGPRKFHVILVES